MGNVSNKLTSLAVRQAKAPPGKKRCKLSDGGGLYLLLTEAGGKYWRWDYTYRGKRKTLAFGAYPDVSLKEARELRDKARLMLKKEGLDPATDRRQETAEGTFAACAEHWFERQRARWTASYERKVRRWLDREILPWLGDKLPSEIDAPAVVAVLRRIEAGGHIEKMHRVKTVISRVFSYAITLGAAARNPVMDIHAEALTPVKVTHRATVKTPQEAGALLRAIWGYQGTYTVRAALQVLAYTFVRPGELRFATWQEIDLEEAAWRIPAERMKMRRPHIVPLARQVVAILRELEPLTGRWPYVFPSERTPERALSENTFNAALRRMGYAKDEMCSHGFRGMASTLLHEQGWPSDVIERQLAHAERNAVKAAYNHAEHLPERRRLMQAWADYLDALRDGAEVIPIRGRR